MSISCAVTKQSYSIHRSHMIHWIIFKLLISQFQCIYWPNLDPRAWSIRSHQYAQTWYNL